MPGNEFENKVQKRLEELNLSPSNAVWNHVEKEIRKDRRKRRLLFLLPLLLLLGIGGYWAMQPSSGSSIANSDKKIQNDTKNSVSDPAAVVVSPSGTPEQNSSGKDPVNQPDQKNTSGTAEDKASDVVIEQKTNNPILSNIDHDRSSINAPVKKKKNKVASASHSSVAKNKKIAVLPAVNYGDEKITAIVKNEEKPVADKAQDKTDPSSTTFVDSTQALNPTAQLAVQPHDSTVSIDKKSSTETVKTPAAKITNQQSKTWQWGIVGGIGVSKISEGGLFSAFGQAKMMDAYTGGLNTNIPPPQSLYSIPATINPGMNWNLGVFVQRTLNKKLHLSATLQYNYFSTYSNIGTRVDSTRIISNGSSGSLEVNGYYLNNFLNTNADSGRNKGYRSNYHFLELPITLQFQLNNNNKTPFYWNNGLSIAQLLSTNGLHYDGSTRVYYEDDKLFRKTQLGFHTGLSVKLFNQSKYPLELGPQFNYQFTNLLKPDNADKRHLCSGSLLLRWYIKK